MPIIKVDGISHHSKGAIKKDEIRKKTLEAAGLFPCQQVTMCTPLSFTNTAKNYGRNIPILEQQLL